MPDSPARICAVITEESTEAARAAINRAAAFADLIEIRLDCLRDFDFTKPESLQTLLADKPLPVIITCRAASEGGKQHVEDRIRLRLLVEGARAMANYCDIEAAYYDQAAELSLDASKLIISYHNFNETPADLDKIYERLRERPAAIIKIATRAESVTDNLAAFRLLDRARGDGRQLIALAMGEPGLISRLLGPSRGSFLTYGSLAGSRESAPGQITCEQMRHLYRAQTISANTAITGIIGRPIAHSASPAMHNLAFQALGLDFVYLPIEVDNAEEFFARFVRPDARELDWQLRGLSVTIPHKTAILPLLDELDETAKKIGAVNTIVVSEGRIIGHNTDVEGAIEPLAKRGLLEGESFAVIGAGGAARAVVYGLTKAGARVTVFARDPAKARSMAESFGVAVSPLESFASSDASVVINTTPVGLRGHSEDQSIVPRAALRPRRIAYDMIYNPIETKFLSLAREAGCQTISGIEMLVCQAALQFKLWTGQEASVDLMLAAALEKIKTRLDGETPSRRERLQV